jgi:dihydropteroate synthase
MLVNNIHLPKLMGIVNGTPDSFYHKSRIDKLSINGSNFQYADIVDIGFESSRPGAAPLSEKDEISRLEYFLAHYPHFHHTLSIDTYKPHVASIALNNGFKMINDIMGGGINGEMLEIASKFNSPIVIMHMKENPATMQNSPYYDNIVDELLSYFEYRIKFALDIGLDDSQIIIDPGIGFGKRVIDNDIIIKSIDKFKIFGLPVLIGVSRKSFLCVDDDSAENRLPASLGVTSLAVQNGADIIRTHDVEETYRMLSVTRRIHQSNYQMANMS